MQQETPIAHVELTLLNAVDITPSTGKTVEDVLMLGLNDSIMAVITHNGMQYYVEAMTFDKRVEVLKEKFSSLTKGCEEYNPNPFPSKEWRILPREAENSKEVQDMLILERYTGCLDFDVYPLGTFFGHKPKEYDKIIVRLEWHYKY